MVRRERPNNRFQIIWVSGYGEVNVVCDVDGALQAHGNSADNHKSQTCRRKNGDDLLKITCLCCAHAIFLGKNNIALELFQPLPG